MKSLTSSIRLKLVTPLLLILIGLLTFSIAISTNNTTQIERNHWVEHTLKIISAITTLENLVLRTKKQILFFKITNEKSLILDANSIFDEVNLKLSELQILTSDNSVQVERWTILKELLSVLKFDVVTPYIQNSNKVSTINNSEYLVYLDEIYYSNIEQIITLALEMEKSLHLERSTLQQDTTNDFNQIVIIIFCITVIVIGFLIWMSEKNIIRPIIDLRAALFNLANGDGNLNTRLPEFGNDEINDVGVYFNQFIRKLQTTLTDMRDQMHELTADINEELNTSKTNKQIENVESGIKALMGALQLATDKNRDHKWLENALVTVSRNIEGDDSLQSLSQNILNSLDSILNIPISTIYVQDENSSQYIFSGAVGIQKERLPTFIEANDDIFGKVIKNSKIQYLAFDNHPILSIKTSITECHKLHTAVIPIAYNGETIAILELASLVKFSYKQKTLIEKLSETLSSFFVSAISRVALNKALADSEEISEELQKQQIEIESANDSLEEANIELDKHVQQLQQTQVEIENKNNELEEAKQILDERAEQLALSSKYKSEFLANMSHELRTPLNSIMLLSKMLASGDVEGVAEEPMRHCQIINDAGRSLLQLINEILDMAKIESGKMPIHISQCVTNSIFTTLEEVFAHTAKDNGLELFFHNHLHDMTIVTDKERLLQVLRNFLSNALKFTKSGTVNCSAYPHKEELNQYFSQQNEWQEHVLQNSQDYIIFEVTDTGPGIAEDKYDLVFEAFQQVDGSVSREFGGTGLGMSISMQIAKLLNGGIGLKSELGKGSSFYLSIPIKTSEGSVPSTLAPSIQNTQLPTTYTLSNLDDDQHNLASNKPTLLIIEDDSVFAKVLMSISREQGFQVIYANDGKKGIRLAERYLPHAILLDIRLPEISGWDVLRHLKKSASTGEIPVHVISVEDEQHLSLQLGALTHNKKPISKEQVIGLLDSLSTFEVNQKNVLIIEDNLHLRVALAKLFSNADFSFYEAEDSSSAMNVLEQKPIDICILDLSLANEDGLSFLKLKELSPSIKDIPVIIYTGKEISPSLELQLRELANSIVIKTVHSDELLLEEAQFFLNSVQKAEDNKLAKIEASIGISEDIFKQKHLLIVDDDIRNIFSLNALLTNRGLTVTSAMNGQEALDILAEKNDINLVLMDIMMPVMDGYEAIKNIRANDATSDLPIIALTAKASKEDKALCLKAGANDYLAKPVDYEQLISLIRIWLNKI